VRIVPCSTTPRRSLRALSPSSRWLKNDTLRSRSAGRCGRQGLTTGDPSRGQSIRGSAGRRPSITEGSCAGKMGPEHRRDGATRGQRTGVNPIADSPGPALLMDVQYARSDVLSPHTANDGARSLQSVSLEDQPGTVCRVFPLPSTRRLLRGSRRKKHLEIFY